MVKGGSTHLIERDCSLLLQKTKVRKGAYLKNRHLLVQMGALYNCLLEWGPCLFKMVRSKGSLPCSKRALPVREGPCLLERGPPCSKVGPSCSKRGLLFGKGASVCWKRGPDCSKGALLVGRGGPACWKRGPARLKLGPPCWNGVLLVRK